MIAGLASRLARWRRRSDPPAAVPASAPFTVQEYQLAVATLAGKPVLLTDRQVEVLRLAGKGLGQIAAEARAAARRRASPATTQGGSGHEHS